MLKPEKGTVAQRLAKLIAAGVLASAMCAPAVAFAGTDDWGANHTPEQTESDGAASTVLKMKLIADNDEYAAPNDNIKFSVPAQINFAAKASGELTGPSASATYLQNGSSFPVRAASMKVTPAQDWDFVSSSSIGSTTAENAVYLGITPNDHSDAKVDASAHKDAKAYLVAENDASVETKRGYWTMQAASAPDADTTTHQVALGTGGTVKNVTKNIADEVGVQFGTIQWYVTPGGTPEGNAHTVYDVSETYDVDAAGARVTASSENQNG